MALPKSKLKIAVIGAGRWGPNLIQNFQMHPQCSVEWICDVDPKRLAVLRKKYDGIAATTDWESVISCKDVDAIVISTPTASHYPLAKRALEEGKHVFVEKPLATNTKEAMELAVLSRNTGLQVMVGHVFLFHPAVRFLKTFLAGGELGEILYLYSLRTNLGPIRADVNALWDLAPHDLAMILYLLGQLPEGVSGIGSSFINPPVEDVVFSTLRFSNGILANLHVSWLDPKKVRQLVIVGSQKMLVFDDMSPSEPIKIYDKNVGSDLSEGHINDTIHLFRHSIKEGTVTIPFIESSSEPLKNECEAFVNAVQEGVSQPSTVAFGADVVWILENITASMAKKGAPIVLTEVSRSFEQPPSRLLLA